MKQTARTFIAVEMDESVLGSAARLIRSLAKSQADVKWVEPHNLHLTLKFLGEVPLEEIHAVCKAVGRGAAGVEPFRLDLVGIGAFPNIERPRTLWLGADEGQVPMAALQQAVEHALKKLGYPPEGRKFKTHLTLGRVRRAGPGIARLTELLAQHASFQAGATVIEQVTVFASELTREGPVYSVLGRAGLG
ncbi:MAG: RNA 2',3'-cyclic phosphodiesterase [Patescibacteria group bacterium]|nr:RNA 2',3'-cyclic phosphodiesterase [Patescibacteria group bacterium]